MKFKTLRFVSMALMLAGTCIAAQADQLADVKARGTLICGVMNNLPPFGYQDPNTREIVGYDVDFCKEVAAIIGVKPELKALSLQARIPELLQARVDLLAAVLGYSQARAEQIQFSDGYFVSEHKMAVRTGTGYKKRDDLAGKRLSAIKGSSTQAFLQKVLPSATLLSFEDAPSAFIALTQGKVEGFALSESLLRQFIAKLGPNGNIEVVSPAVGQEVWGLGLRKDEPAMTKAVNDALEKMEKSGAAQRIFDKWLGKTTEFKMERAFKIVPIPTN
jgi:polar amino acid transport system substrate-binding protein